MTEEEFKNTFVPLTPKMAGIAWRYLQNKQDAEDIVQDVLFRLWNKRSEMKEVKNWEGFAIQMVKNAAIDKQRKEGIRSHQQIDDALDRADQKGPDNLLDEQEKVRFLQNELARMPKEQQTLFRLREIEGYSYQEIEEKLNMTVNHIRVSISRIRKSLRDRLTKLDLYGEKADR